MTELRFDDRVAIVTGAGGNPGLGRAHAMLLAERGARVVVNDIGSGSGAASAAAVVEEITAKGGTAVADAHNVATEDGARAIVQTALDAFGGVDIVVNNAAIAVNAAFDVLRPEDFRRTFEVNLLGPVLVSQAAWPHMKAKGYGRIVNITSGSAAGMAETSAYIASKGGVYALTRALAVDGEPFGIQVNSVSPMAFTQMILQGVEEDCPTFQYLQRMPAELVSPAVAFLAHESCTLTGECLDVGGGAVRRLYWAMTQGIADPALTPEMVAGQWDKIAAGTSDARVGLVLGGSGGIRHKPYRPEAV
jgi:NAD(P)-dependent dehydrogenase (short-subunit alcohol dehydrogenase family)